MQDVDQKQKSIGSGLMKSYKQLTEEIIQEADVSTGGQKFRANLFNPINQLGRGIKKTPEMIGKGISSAAKYTGTEAGKMPFRALKGIADISKANPALGWGVKGVALAGLLYGGYQANRALRVAQEKGEEIKRRGGFI